MTTNDKQPTGWVVVDFDDGLATFRDSRNWQPWYGQVIPFASRSDANSYKENLPLRKLCEVHPWPLPQEAIQRLKEKHPGQDWSQVPVADAPVEKPGRWVIESLRPVTDHRYRDKADWHGTADRVSLPWRRLADVQGFMQRNYWSPLDYRVVNLDDLPAAEVETKEKPGRWVIQDTKPDEIGEFRDSIGWRHHAFQCLNPWGSKVEASEAAVTGGWRLPKFRVVNLDDLPSPAVAEPSEVERLRAEVERLTRERDEAREQLGKARLSRLDEFAKAALSGMLADPERAGAIEDFAADAVEYAQSTIRALDGAGGA